MHIPNITALYDIKQPVAMIYLPHSLNGPKKRVTVVMGVLLYLILGAKNELQVLMLQYSSK